MSTPSALKIVAATPVDAATISVTITPATVGTEQARGGIILLKLRHTAASSGASAIMAKVTIPARDVASLVYRVPIASSAPVDFEDELNVALKIDAATTITVAYVADTADTAAAAGVKLTLFAIYSEV